VYYERIFNAANAARGGLRAELNMINDVKNAKGDKEDVSDDEGDQMMAEALVKEEEAVGQVAKKKKVSFVEMYGKDVGDYVEKIKQEIDAKHKDDGPPFAAVRALFPPLPPVPPPGMADADGGKFVPQVELRREELQQEEELRRLELEREELLREVARRGGGGGVVFMGKRGPGPKADGGDRW